MNHRWPNRRVVSNNLRSAESGVPDDQMSVRPHELSRGTDIKQRKMMGSSAGRDACLILYSGKFREVQVVVVLGAVS